MKKIALLFATPLALIPRVSYAYETIVIKKTDYTLEQFSLKLIYGTVLPVLSVLALGALVWGGVNIIMAGGEDAKVAKGRAIITYAIVGILLIICAYGIISLLGKTIWQSFNYN